MRNNEITDLVDKLRRLSIEKSRIHREEEITLEELGRALSGTPTLPSSTSAPEPAPASSSTHPTLPFQVGEVVYIKNPKLLPVGQRNLRFGRVTSIKEDSQGSIRVYLSILGQGDTWRAPRNLRKLTATERREYQTLARQES